MRNGDPNAVCVICGVQAGRDKAFCNDHWFQLSPATQRRVMDAFRGPGYSKAVKRAAKELRE